MTEPPPADFCPYVGLRPFTAAEQAYFFGRRSETRVVAANLFASSLTVFYGPSAVGKSSVLQAGVIPKLRREPKTAVLYFRDWQHDDYLDRLKAECRRAIALADGSSLDIDDALPLDQWIDAALEQFRGQLHILLDQFEEYLLYHPDGSPNAFDGELAAAVNRREIGGRFLIGLREDGLARLDRFRKRIPNLLGNTLRLRRLSLAAAREAIEGPLRVYNEQQAGASPPLAIEPELVSAVIEQVRADQVTTAAAAGEGLVRGHAGADEVETAYLQLVMERLWRERAPSNGRLVLQHATLERLGGAKAIAKSHFNEHLERLTVASADVGDMVCDLFAHLVTPTGSKISQKEGDLLALTSVPGERVRWFLSELVAARLLRVTDPPERYEIFHDALAKPFLDARNAIVLQRANAARQNELRRARRFKRLAIGAFALAVAAVLSAAFAAFAWYDAQRARDQAERARQEADRAREEIANITEQHSALSSQLQARIDTLTSQLAATTELSADERRKLLAESESSKAELARLNAQYAQVQQSRTETATVERDLANARTLITSLEAKLGSAQEQVTTLTAERDTARDTLSRTRASLEAAQADIDRLKREVDDLRQKLEAASREAPGGTTGTPADPDAPPADGRALPTGDYRSLYQRGITAFERRQWEEAAQLFAAAALQKGDARESVRIYGMRVEPYLPHYYLGRSYRELGRCEDALRAWAQSEKEGVVMSYQSAYNLLQEGRAACQPKD